MLQPTDIYAEIKSQPPLMRDEAGQKYIGREVEWLVTFDNGWESKGQAHLSFGVEPHVISMVKGTVSLTEYPWLKSLRADKVVRVRGRISRIDGMAITLDKLELSLPEAANA